MPLHPDAQQYLDFRNQNGYRPVDELDPDAGGEQAKRFALVTRGEDVASVKDREIPGPYGPIPPAGVPPQARNDAAAGGLFSWRRLGDGQFGYGRSSLSLMGKRGAVCGGVRELPACAGIQVSRRGGRFRTQRQNGLPNTPPNLKVTRRNSPIAGTSAGGNLAAVVSLMARDRGGPPIVFQLLMVPITDYNFETDSYTENAEGYGLTSKAMKCTGDII